MKTYQAKYIGKQTDTDGITFDLWTFASERTQRKYHVRIEYYQEHMLAIKFYPAKEKKNKRKYEILTNDREPRTIVCTVLNIMMHYYDTNERASFIFIGSRLRNENTYCNTKRFRFYRTMTSLLISDKHFIHKYSEEHSIYMLLRRSEVEQGKITGTDILKFYNEYFDIE